MSRSTTLLAPGRNCERLAPAQRVAWLIDGERYFGALAEAIERAERSVLLLGWDFHSRVRLCRGGEGGGEDLVQRLERVVRARPRLHVRILAWDFAMIYALEREFLPLERFARRTHRRIHFRLDGRHPVGASHHQKIAVIDDAVAFCGGLDVTACRWDTRAHLPDDPRRSDPGFESYKPFHDAGMLVDGGAARALGAIARERWRRATGRRLRAWDAPGDPWPQQIEPDLREVAVAVARTQPAYAGAPELRHVEALYVDAIRAARHSIYLENQYFTSTVVCDALAERLAEPDAPEVVLVLPRSLSGWLEERTMGVLMARAVRRLREVDRGGRFRALVPVLPGDVSLTVHSKLMLVDGRFARIGSANLSNRSMGLDTECDLAVEVAAGSPQCAAIEALRDGLLAEHLGAKPDEVARAIRERGSLVAAVDALHRGERRLDPYDDSLDDVERGVIEDTRIFDPERPIPFEELRDQLVGHPPEGESASGPRRALPRVALAIALPLALLALWKFTPLAEWISPESLSAAAAPFEQGIGGRLLGLGVFVAASLVLVPVVSLIVASGLVYGFAEGALIGLFGSVLSATAGYALGRLLWRDAVGRLAGPRLEALNANLERRGIVASLVVRVVPIAPFAIVNLVAGASRVRLRDFLIGTVLGMAPGTAALAFFGERAARVMREPSAGTIAAAVAGAVAVVALAVIAQRVFGRRRTGSGAA